MALGFFGVFNDSLFSDMHGCPITSNPHVQGPFKIVIRGHYHIDNKYLLALFTNNIHL